MVLQNCTANLSEMLIFNKSTFLYTPMIISVDSRLNCGIDSEKKYKRLFFRTRRSKNSSYDEILLCSDTFTKTNSTWPMVWVLSEIIELSKFRLLYTADPPPSSPLLIDLNGRCWGKKSSKITDWSSNQVFVKRIKSKLWFNVDW